MDGQPIEGLSTTTTGKAGMGQKEWGHSPLEEEWTHLVGEITPCLGFWFLILEHIKLLALHYSLPLISSHMPCSLGTIFILSPYFLLFALRNISIGILWG
jgi:hypothetical protein